MVIIFFFQAEDGIRDGHVTGVQTCALPISALNHCRYKTLPKPIGITGLSRVTGCWSPEAMAPSTSPLPSASSARRSEERRVGKECRYRRAPEQEKNRNKEATHRRRTKGHSD